MLCPPATATIDEAVGAFLGERARAPRGDDVPHPRGRRLLLRSSPNGSACDSLDELERKRRRKAFDAGDEEAPAKLVGPEGIVEQLGEFLGSFTAREVIAGRNPLRAPGTGLHSVGGRAARAAATFVSTRRPRFGLALFSSKRRSSPSCVLTRKSIRVRAGKPSASAPVELLALVRVARRGFAAGELIDPLRDDPVREPVAAQSGRKPPSLGVRPRGRRVETLSAHERDARAGSRAPSRSRARRVRGSRRRACRGTARGRRWPRNPPLRSGRAPRI